MHESCWWSPKKVTYVPQQRVATASAASSGSTTSLGAGTHALVTVIELQSAGASAVRMSWKILTSSRAPGMRTPMFAKPV